MKFRDCSTGLRTMKWRKLFRFEQLESRIPLAADLAILNAYLADINAAQIPGIVEGDSVVARVNYTTSGLDSSMQFKVRMELDGVPIESEAILGAAGTGLQYYRFYRIGYASPGSHQIRITLDSGNQIAESNEGNNVFQFSFVPTKTTIPQKLRFPVPGNQSESLWTLVNYVDNDVRETHNHEYRDGFMTYDQHTGMDFFFPEFKYMDQGWPVYAAADGVVTETVDGNFDREDFWDFTLPDPRIANYVFVDHGGGWRTAYFHLQRDTVSVKVGDVVKAGQTLGTIGSSGISDGPHVHFELQHNFLPVDPFLAASDYWVTPLTYIRDRAPKATTVGMTDRDPIPEFFHGPNDIRVYQLNGTVYPHLFYRLEYGNVNDQFVTDWIRPNGTLYFRDTWNAPVGVRYMRMWHYSSAVDAVGTWTVVAKRNGVEVARQTYQVVSGTGAPEIDLRQGTTLIIDGRSTPINFGSVAKNAVQPELSFSVNNRGTAPLSITSVSVPQGFQIVGAAPSLIQANQTATLRLRMLTDEVDHQWGDVVLLTNDSDEGRFVFAVEGFVTGSRNSNAPNITGPTLGFPIEQGLAAAFPFNQLQLIDSDTSNFQGSRIVSEIISGALESGIDRLILFLPSTDWSTVQNLIYFQGQAIANILQDGSSGRIELQITANATRTQVEQLARSIAFWQQSSVLAYKRRIVELKLIDPTGLSSQSLQRAVLYGQTSLNHPPLIPTITNRVLSEDQVLGPLDLLVSDINDSLASLTLAATSSNPSLFPSSNVQVSFSGGKWQLVATPVQNAAGEAFINLTATDPSGAKFSTGFSISVVSQNDLPNISTISDQFVSQLDTLAPIPFQISDTETPASQLQLSATSTNTSLITSGGIVFDGTDTDRTVTLSPIAGQFGTSTIKITVTDSDGGQSFTTFVLTVTPESEPPTISTIANVDMLEDETASIPFTVGDNFTPINQLVLSATSNNSSVLPVAGISFNVGSGAGREVVLRPLSNASGSSQVVVTVKDLAGNQAKQTFMVNVGAVNDPPTFTAPTSVTANEDATSQSFNLTSIVAGGGEQQPLQVSVNSDDGSFFKSISVDYLSPQSTGRVNWEPAANRFGSASIYVTLTDGCLDRDLSTASDNLSLTNTVAVVLAAVNDAPTITVPAQLVVDEDASGQLTTLTGISPGPNESQSMTLSAVPANPSLFQQFQLNYVNGSNEATIAWTPAANKSGTTEVVVQLTDAGLDGDLATTQDNLVTRRTMSITVIEVNDSPQFSFQQPNPILEDAGNQSLPLSTVSSGSGETQQLKWTVVAAPVNSVASATVDFVQGQSNATLRWTPSSNYFGDLSLTVTLMDAGIDNNILTLLDNSSISLTVNVTVTGVNDAPSQLVLPNVGVPENTKGFLLGATQVTDVDDSVFTFTTSDPRFVVESGALRLAPDAMFNYEVERSISLDVTVADPSGAQLKKSVVVQVLDQNEPISDITIAPYFLYQEIQQQDIGSLTVVDPDTAQTHAIVSLDSRFVVQGKLLKLADGATIAAGTSQVIVPLRVTDNSSSPLSNDFQLVLQVTSVSSPWRNPKNSLDVTANNLISPSDALQIINYLNSGNSKVLNVVSNPPLARGPFLDTSGDRLVTPSDALLVINYLNRNRSEGEAEPTTGDFQVFEFETLRRRQASMVDQALVEIFRKARSHRS